jgi:hypothetical protein
MRTIAFEKDSWQKYEDLRATNKKLGSPEMWVICFRGSSFSPKNLNLERSPNFSLARQPKLFPSIVQKRAVDLSL